MGVILSLCMGVIISLVASGQHTIGTAKGGTCSSSYYK